MDRRKQNLFAVSGSNDQDGCHPIYGKNPLKIFFSETKGSMALELGTQHWEHGPNKV